MQGETRLAKQGELRSRRWWGSAVVAVALAAGAFIGVAQAQVLGNNPITVSLSASATTVAVNSTVVLTATASAGVGTIKTVAFYRNGSMVAQTSAPPYTYNFTPSAPGSYTFTAVAVNNFLAQATSNPVTITATGGTNLPPTVSLSVTPTTISQGESTALSAMPADTDGTVTKVTFYNGTTAIGTSTGLPWTLNYVPAAAGTFSLTAVATDNQNATGTSSPVTLTVNPGGGGVGNAPPTVSLAASATTVQPGTAVNLTAIAQDINGTISKVEFYNGAALLSTDTTSPYTGTFTPAAVGTYTVSAKAYDNLGAIGVSNSITITAQAGANAPPTVSLAASATTVQPGTAVNLTANAQDSDGTISKVEFYNGAALLSTDMTSPYTGTFTPAAVGTFTVSAKAYDNLGATGVSNSITITAQAAPPASALPRITLSLSGTLFSPGASVTLTGTATAVAPATVSKVTFYQNGTKILDDLVAPYTTTATLTNAGSYAFYAVVTDSLGQVMSTLNQVAVAQTAPAVASTDPDIIRLLNQATFGASQAEAARVVALGIPGWINDQMAQPVSGYPDTKYNRIQLTTTVDCTTQMPNGTNYPGDSPQAVCARDHLTLAMVQRDFFTNAMYAPDQLRQRVAWALSQVTVTSANEPDLSFAHVMSRYQSILFQEAFGNYQNLLQKITYNPAMGNYLDMVNNDRPSGTKVPNENYAREIMQLFSVGLEELNLDGSPILDAQGVPVPTYSQTDISEFARVFTGYTYADAAGTPANGKRNARYYGSPLVPYPTTATTGHDPNSKTLLNGTVLPAGQTGQQDIDAAVLNVFTHPNTGVFIARHLIQHMVTGNPTPAYIARVAAVFNNNGSGVRGDMAAVVKAVLLDTEARGPTKVAADFGQLREPVLMVTSLLRATNALTDGARLEGATNNLSQRPFYSPTVFSYFMPNSKVPGTSILGPEFGIHTTVTAVGRANLVYTLVYGGYAPDTTIPNASGTKLFLAPFEAIADNPAAMVSLLNQHLAGGQFPAALEATIVTAVNAITISTPPTAAERTARARMAVYLMASSYDYQVQR